MGLVNLDDVEGMEAGTRSDWLGVERVIRACSTTASLTKNKPAAQDDLDFLPFDPDFQAADPQQIISSLPQLKDCEFDHNYILHYLEQLEIDPTLCSKCSIANKYFASPEPFVQDLYKKLCY